MMKRNKGMRKSGRKMDGREERDGGEVDGREGREGGWKGGKGRWWRLQADGDGR